MIQQVTQGSRSQLTQMQADIVSMKNTFLADLTSTLDQNSNERQQFHNRIGAVQSDILNDSRQERDSIITAIQHESLHTQAELASLRDVLLKLMTGNESSAAIDGSTASRFTGRGNTDLATQVGKQLLKTPSSLKDVCEKTILAKKPIEDDLDRRHRLKKNERSCVCVRKHSARRVGLFGIAHDFRAPYAKKCSYHRSHWWSWSYSLSVRLLPIVQRTVEITLAANFGAGGSSIGP